MLCIVAYMSVDPQETQRAVPVQGSGASTVHGGGAKLLCSA